MRNSQTSGLFNVKVDQNAAEECVEENWSTSVTMNKWTDPTRVKEVPSSKLLQWKIVHLTLGYTKYLLSCQEECLVPL